MNTTFSKLLCLVTLFLAGIAAAQAGGPPTAAVPEPTTLSLIGLVVAGCAAGYKFSKRKGRGD